MKKVLVTGAGGFIGSHLSERLVAKGDQVRAFLRYTSRSDRGNLKYLSPKITDALDLFYGDLSDLDTVRKAVKGVEVIFHLGALIGIPYSYLHPQEVAHTNILGTLNILIAAREEGIKRVVQTSTSEVYGTASYVPIDERHPKEPRSPYAASKVAADALALSFFRSFELPVAILRPFNTYGPRQSARAIIPSCIRQALEGNQIRAGNTRPTRDFTYVTDTVEAFLRIAETEDAVGEEVNVGSGREIAIRDLIEKIGQLTGHSLNILEEGVRIRPKESEVMRLCADNSKARRLLQWGPTVSLEEGLQKTIAFMAENPLFYPSEQYVI